MTSRATTALRTLAGTTFEKAKKLLAEATWDDSIDPEDMDEDTIIAMFHLLCEIEMGSRDPETLERNKRFKVDE